jgi:hypothetical protein
MSGEYGALRLWSTVLMFKPLYICGICNPLYTPATSDRSLVIG